MISESYREQNRLLHETNEHYGTSGHQWREAIRSFAEWGRMGILDYGAGKRTLSKSLGPAYRVTDYDPCVPGIDTPPVPHDFVVCGDVMEHVEPEFVDSVLQEVRRLALKKAFFVIHLVEAAKHLPDGRNAHISLHPLEWWKNAIEKAGFTVTKYDSDSEEKTSWFLCQ